MKISSFLSQLTKKLVAIPTWYYLLIIIIVGAVARLADITKAAIWHDEGYTMMLIQHGPLEIIERTARDVHPPLYYLVAHGWQSLFGMSEMAVRSLSAVLGVATIVIVYLLMRRLFSEGTARLAGLLVALGPFAVRYSEEARMYGMAAFLIVLASYFIVRIAAEKSPRLHLWVFYALAIAAGLYTHYYTLFIIPVHIIYLAWVRGGLWPLLRDWKWWLGNGLAGVLFLPWVPVAFAQMSRVKASYWIPPATLETPANTFTHFIAYVSSPSLGWISGALMTLFFIGLIHTYLKRQKLRQQIGLLTIWLILPLATVIILSIVRPIYYDRYFVYCAVALYMLIAVILTRGVWFVKNPPLQYASIIVTCLIFVVGIFSVGQQASHKMDLIGGYVSDNYQVGDAVVSAELYTYFDFSYYNKTPVPTQLLSEQALDGYGETSLIYDRQDEVVINNLESIEAPRIWLVGKVGQKDYYESKIPPHWQLTEQTEAGDSAVRLYQINAE